MPTDDDFDSAIPAAPAQPPAGHSLGAPPGTGASPAQPAGGAGLPAADPPAQPALLAVLDRQQQMLARLVQRSDAASRQIASIEERLMRMGQVENLDSESLSQFLTSQHEQSSESTSPAAAISRQSEHASTNDTPTLPLL